MQLKLTRFRNKSMMELDQGLREKSEKFEKEKNTLIEQNKQLRKEMDKVCICLSLCQCVCVCLLWLSASVSPSVSLHFCVHFSVVKT